MVEEINKVGVVGLGTMGAGIVEVFARAGFTVTGVEIDDAALERGRTHLEKSLAKAVAKGKLTEDEQRAILGRVTFTTSRDDLADAHLAVEAVPERLDIKRSVFADLDRILPPAAILATNTSSLSVTEIAALTSRPGKVIGLHFFNPAPVMRLVEIVTTVVTEPHVRETATQVVTRLGKTPVAVGDRAGFVANALLVPYLNHAVAVYEQGLATREQIDTAITSAAGFPMGPLTLMDLVGLDVLLDVMDVLWDEFRRPRYAAAPLLRRMVAAGLLGRKSGRGFYDYSGADNPAEPEPTAPLAQLVGDGPGQTSLADLLLVPHLNDAARMIGDGYATADDVDTAMRLGCGYPKGLAAMLDERGVKNVTETLAELAAAGLFTDDTAPLLTMLAKQGKDTLRS